MSWLESLRMDVGYERCNGAGHAKAWGLAIGGWIRQWALYGVCKIRGHRLEDHSRCGRDSGSVDVVCLRCGASWYTQLY